MEEVKENIRGDSIDFEWDVGEGDERLQMGSLGQPHTDIREELPESKAVRGLVNMFVKGNLYATSLPPKAGCGQQGFRMRFRILSTLYYGFGV